MQPRGEQVEDYSCESAVKTCTIQTVELVLDWHLTAQGDKAESNATFTHTVRAIEAARKHTCQIHTTVICNKVENGYTVRKLLPTYIHLPCSIYSVTVKH